jgi:glucans biosynthesis protein
MQRERAFTSYQDLWARYESRPSLWVEPQGDWGKGAVTLVEIPTGSEFYDNIVAYWDPAEPIRAGSEFSFAYRASWGEEPAGRPAVTVAASRAGQSLSAQPTPTRQFVVDFADPYKASTIDRRFGPVLPTVEMVTSAGVIFGTLVSELPQAGWRVAFQLDPYEAKSADLTLRLRFPDGRTAETWMYRWSRD